MTRENTQSRFIEMYGTIEQPKTRQVQLGEICSVKRGGSPRPIADFITDDPQGLNWIKIGDADDSMYITHTSERIKPEGLSKTRQVHSGDLLLSNSMSFGRPYILKIDGCIHDGWLVLHFDHHTINPIFLCLYLSQATTYAEMAKLAAGGVVNNLNAEIVQTLKINLPNMDEQLDFVAIANQADKSKFVVRFFGFKSRFFEQFSNPKIARVPLIDLCSLFIDGDWIEAKDQSNSGYRLVQTGNVGVCEYLDKEEHSRFVSEETFKRLNCTEIHSGDILFSRLPEPIGRCCIIPKGFPKAITAVDCTITRLKDNCLPEYLMVYTTTAMYSEQIKKCITGTTRQRISRGNLAKIVVPLPDLQQQKEFVLLVHQADKSKYLN